MNPISLEGKVVVIVGGTRGIGLSAARACMAAGARVVVIGNNPEAQPEVAHTLGDAGRCIFGDATDPGVAPRAIDVAVQTFGAFHALYHVAGGSGRLQGDGPLDAISDAGWDYTVRLNLTSVFYSNRAAIQYFLRTDTPGVVLNLSSVLAFSPSAPLFATHSYAASKAGIIGLTQSAAAHYAARNIRFNVLAPGLIATPMSQRAQMDPVIQQYIRRKQPLDGGRIGQGLDLEGAAIFLLSDAARFVTGQVLAVDGGWSVSEGPVSCG